MLELSTPQSVPALMWSARACETEQSRDDRTDIDFPKNRFLLWLRSADRGAEEQMEAESEEIKDVKWADSSYVIFISARWSVTMKKAEVWNLWLLCDMWLTCT